MTIDHAAIAALVWLDRERLEKAEAERDALRAEMTKERDRLQERASELEKAIRKKIASDAWVLTVGGPLPEPLIDADVNLRAVLKGTSE